MNQNQNEDLCFLIPESGSKSTLLLEKRKPFAEPHPLTSLLIQLNKNTLASTLNCFFGNPEKSYIPKYSKISSNLVNAQKPKQIKTINSNLHESQA